MFIDFFPVRNHETKWLDFAQQFTLDNLRAATHTYYAAMFDIIAELDDAHLTFEPFDPDASDIYAPESEQNAGWNLAHIILHVTASLEEGAAFSSILARGISIGGRLRSEPDWKTYTTREQVVQRLLESYRIVSGYLDTWLDEPRLDVYREMSEKFVARNGELNAPAQFLYSLMHLDGHLDQMRDARQQALTALALAAVGD